MRVEQIGSATLYLADNNDVMPSLPRPSAIIGDPPYGQKLKTNIVQKCGIRTYGPLGPRGGDRIIRARIRTRNGTLRGSGESTVWPDLIHGDDKPFDPQPWIHAADRVLLWGAHKFADRLPLGSWLIWDKVPTGKIRDQGDGEAAWINDADPRALRIFRLLWDGVCVGSAARHEVTAGQSRVHPTQKPVALMAWCIMQARLPSGSTICDPWMGAGSTGVAAVKAGHPFVGIEIEPVYFEMACRRIEEAYCQRDLFVPTYEGPTQATTDLFAETAV